MFTFTGDKTAPLFFVDNRPVYTQFKKDPALRIHPFRDTSKYLDSDEFREEFTLSKVEATALKRALQTDTVPEGALKSKFYTVRKSLNEKLFTTIDLRGTDKTIEWRFPKDVKAWPGTSIYVGSSNSGKTYAAVSRIEESLRRPKKRKHVYVSPELETDATLKKLLNTKRWTRWFQGIDVSDKSFEESERGSPDEWWKTDIEPILKSQPPGTSITLDDAPDCLVHKHLQKFLIKYLRTGRHRRVGITSLQHNVRGGRWTSQSFSSVKTIVLFPRAGGKGKQVDWLYETLGVGRRRARDLVELFAEHGRVMVIHQWSPSVIFGPKYAVWV